MIIKIKLIILSSNNNQDDEEDNDESKDNDDHDNDNDNDDPGARLLHVYVGWLPGDAAARVAGAASFCSSVPGPTWTTHHHHEVMLCRLQQMFNS